MFCIKTSLIVNIPINILTIKNIVKDKRLIDGFYKEISEDSKEYKVNLNKENIEYEYKKVINEIYATKIQLESDEMNKEYNYISNGTNKEKVFILKK